MDHLQTVFYIFLLISLGLVLGNLHYKNFSLDIAGLLIVSLVAGHFGIVIPEDFKYFGLAIFIYAIGLQTGPGFFDSLKNEGLKLNLLSLTLLSLFFFSIVLVSYLLGYNSSISAGIYTGVITSAPALASALEIKNDHTISVIFGIVYPFALVATVLVFRILPIVFKIDFNKEYEKYKEEVFKEHPPILTKNFKITNEIFKKEKVKKSDLERLTGTVVERIASQHEIGEIVDDFVIHYGDILRVTGTVEQLKRMKIVAGEETEADVQFKDDMKIYRLLVSNKDVVGKKINELKELYALGGRISKVRRAGIDISPMPEVTLMLGDKLYIVGPEKNKDKIIKLIGDNLMAFPSADFIPISFGIVLGMLIGYIPIGVPFVGVFRLSFVGGILLCALIFGRLGRTGPIVWQLSPHSNNLMKVLGQLLFVATVGTNAGRYLVESLASYGIYPVLFATVTLIIIIFSFSFYVLKILKMNGLQYLGFLAGTLTSTPSLGVINNMVKNELPSISYAAVYPFSLIVSLIFAEVIFKLI
ncbi:aspartate:alanine exchanger family transporter [Deferribacter abyssi]|uniref:aspartate:alanine exchanger family transporter n=1 Tax=Deferribacter abyssi TaxID=213806 RepID=UPI003C162F59